MLRTATVLAATAFLSACSGGKDHILPQGGPSMQEVYAAHFARTRQFDTEGARARIGGRSPGAEDDSLAGWTRAAHTEIESIFPRLPNPDLVMYVFPHLSAEGHPVPGYATTFPLYESVQYALPGEAEGR